MQNVSARFLKTIAVNHQIYTYAEVWSGIGGALIKTIGIVDGSTTEDVANAVRRTGSITVAPTDANGNSLVPVLGSDLLTPYGNEIHLYRGVKYFDGTTEVCPLGVYGITTVTTTGTSFDNSITVAMADRADRVGRGKLLDYYSIAAGSDLGTAITTLIQNAVPALTSAYFNFYPTSGVYTTPTVTMSPGDDPWQQAQALATSAGFDLYFDQSGICVMVPTPNPVYTVVSYTYNTDVGSILEQLSRILTNQNVVNHVIVLASGTGIAVPLRSDSYDLNPSSPTYIYGPYGDVPMVISTSTAITQAQCQATGDAALLRALGLTASGALSGLVNPAQLVNDVVFLQSSKVGYAGKYGVLDSLTIPLAVGGSMSANLRQVAGR